MNLLESSGFLFELSRRPGRLVLMPDGLYDERGRCLRSSRRPAAGLLSVYLPGDAFRLLKLPSISRLFADQYLESFELSTEPALGTSSSVPPPVPLGLSIEEAMRRIDAFSRVSGKTIYERFLEYMVILACMESLKNSKVTLGGIWTSETADPSGRRVNGYEVFVRELEEKNRIVDRLKEAANGYRAATLEEIGLFRVSGPRSWIPAYALYLERFYAILNLRNTLQRFHLMLAYAGEEEKAAFERMMAENRRILASYG